MTATPTEKRHPYLIKQKTRHGKIVFYVWRRPRLKVRLREPYGTKAFWNEYRAALFGETYHPIRPGLAKTVDDARSGIALYRGTTKELIPREQKTAFAIEAAVMRNRSRAKARGWSYDIDFEWAMERVIASGYKCEMTGVPFFDPSGDGYRVHPYSPSIDRIDADLGYTKMNCRIVCSAFNIGKNQWGPDIFDKVSGGFQTKLKALRR